MKKDAYYFPHFCNARSDRKIKRLIKDLGIEGYGIYFMTLETLREQTDFKYPLSDIDLLADEFGTSEAKLQAVVGKYELFNLDVNNNFFSPKLILYLQPYIEKSERARVAANTRWNKINNDNDANAYADALPEHCKLESKCNANQNASKVKESKGEDNIKSIDDSVIKLFEKLWSLYPNKKGKSSISITAKKELFKVGEEVLIKALNKYKKEIKGRETQYIQHGDRFFKKTIFDYIETVQEIEVKNVKAEVEPELVFFDQDYDEEEQEKIIL